MGAPVPLFVDVGYKFCLAGEEDFSVVEEDDLDCSVGEAEEDGMACSDPLFQVD